MILEVPTLILLLPGSIWSKPSNRVTKPPSHQITKPPSSKWPRRVTRSAYNIHICIYVCMYICGYVHMYVCLHVHMYICIYVHMYICIYVSTYICIYVYMYICIYVYMYICIYVPNFQNCRGTFPRFKISNLKISENSKFSPK